MDSAATSLSHDAFFHVRIIVGMVTGLSIARLLSGLARFVQAPGPAAAYTLHIGWCLYLFLAVVHFWWFEFGLAKVGVWTFGYYLFVISYAALFYFIAAVLFPDQPVESGYAGQFHASQYGFYGLLALLFLVDLGDSALKGAEHLRHFGPWYPIRQLLFAGLSVAAMFVHRRPYHYVLLVAVLLAQLHWILTQFDILG